MEPGPTALEAQSLSHWITRKINKIIFVFWWKVQEMEVDTYESEGRVPGMVLRVDQRWHQVCQWRGGFDQLFQSDRREGGVCGQRCREAERCGSENLEVSSNSSRFHETMSLSTGQMKRILPQILYREIRRKKNRGGFLKIFFKSNMERKDRTSLCSCQYKGHELAPSSRNIPHATEQLSL